MGSKLLGSTLAAVLGLLVAGPQLRARDAQSVAARYRVAFETRGPIKGLSAASLIQLPAACTNDGTIFVSLFDPAPVAVPGNPAGEFLAIVPYSGDAKGLRLSDMGEIHDVRELHYYATDSEIVFLVQALEGSATNDQGNAAEQHFYAVTFGRDGKHHHTIRLDDTLRITQLGMFESGSFLAYGFDELSHAPRIALLNSDGSLVEYVQPEEGTLPESAMNKGPGGKGPAVYLSATQLVPHGHSIIVVQNQADSPLLEVDEGGAVRTIRPVLPSGETVNMLIPSDGNPFVRVNDFKDGRIYEIDPQNGKVLKRIDIDATQQGANVVCVHEGKFISFEPDRTRNGAFLSFVGTPKPIASSDHSTLH